MQRLGLALVLALAACAPEGDTAPGGIDATVAEPELDALVSLDGPVTWQLAFDDVAHAAGAVDCSYTRVYSGTEDRSQPWLCPGCDVMVPVSVAVDDASRDCYAQINPDGPSDVEILGWKGTTFYRAGGENYLLSEQGTAEVTADHVGVANASDWAPRDDAAGPGEYQLTVAGTLARADTEGDPQHGFNPPAQYACGWHKANPAPYDGNYALKVGKTLPDGVFRDTCDQPVRLHDFAGAWLVVEISALDCGPCQDAAQAEPAFLAAMAQRGIPTEAVTLLVPSLDDIIGVAPQSDLDLWRASFSLDSPVLADRAWGFWLGYDALGDGFAYPTTIVIDPTLEVRDIEVGWAGSWDWVEAVITGG